MAYAFIGIAGAPGAGKSTLARVLFRRLTGIDPADGFDPKLHMAQCRCGMYGVAGRWTRGTKYPGGDFALKEDAAAVIAARKPAILITESMRYTTSLRHNKAARFVSLEPGRAVREKRIKTRGAGMASLDNYLDGALGDRRPDLRIAGDVTIEEEADRVVAAFDLKPCKCASQAATAPGRKSDLQPRYPVYVISKGRHDCCLTSNFLTRDGVDHKVVVEPQERDLYASTVGGDKLIVTPFSNLGQGGIPARNFVWEHAKATGAERHWILDDNIFGLFRRWKARKLPCEAGPALRAVEDFTDRFENVAISGMNYYMFAPNKTKIAPYFLNVHVYSILLIRNDLPFRWRGRYNEDTDLCLRVLSAGWCTVLFNAFLAWKKRTMSMKGGNATELYKGDGRLKMARSLERQWPHVVDTKRRFQRPQHVIKRTWRAFDQQLKVKPGVDLTALPQVDDYGLELYAKREVKNEALREIVAEAEAGRQP